MFTIESEFKLKLLGKLGEGGQAKVFKGEFHGNHVAMKYVPLDHLKKDYKYDCRSYGCNEFFHQEKFPMRSIDLTSKSEQCHFPSTSLGSFDRGSHKISII